MIWKALLVDDEDHIRTLLAALLERAGFVVQTVASAGAAMEMLRATSFDVVITDLRMETCFAGFEVCRFAHALRNRPLIVILTASPVAPAQWRAVGADALFTKGLNTINFGLTLTRMLEARSTSAAMRRRG